MKKGEVGWLSSL